MKIFIKRISLFLFLFILLLVGILYINDGTLRIDFERDKDFLMRVEFFSDYIDKNDSINLILGSSITEDSIIPDSLGTKWFSFTIASQNIYESYKFIDYYKDSAKIDTIILGIKPFDFPTSYVKNRINNLPFFNGNFHIFGTDSITIIGNILKENLQAFKQGNYFDLDLIISKIKNPSPSISEQILWTRQGFPVGMYRKSVDLDSLFSINPRFNHWVLTYFVNVKSPPNLFYFDLFESLTDSLGIKVIYLITPKSKYYHLGMKEEKYDKIWNDILDSLETKPIEIWDYETMNTDTFDFYYYWDVTHCSYNGAKAFTKIIKNRLLK